MVESPDFTDPVHGIPVFSLYGEVRRPTAAMMSTFDVLLVDLQDVGCRIYTFITTLRYVLEEAARHGKAVWVLDRPNPVGRPIEGLRLRAGWESFVGAGPLPMRHGLTMGELARWFVATLRLKVDCRVVEMQGWEPDAAPGYGWPLGERAWINPSPNVPMLESARCYPGTVHGRGHDAVRRPRHDAAVRALRRARHRRGRRSSRRCTSSRRSGCAAARCAPAGSSRRSTSTSASSAPACRSTSRTATTSTRRSGRGACRRSRSRRCARSSRSIRSGAISPTSTSATGSRSTCSTAATCCAAGSTTGAARPKDLDDLALADERAWRRERRPFLLY